MKTCAYCAEEIKAEAIVCRFCARPCLTGVESIHMMGRMYAIGQGPDGYAIWNMVTGGGPVLTQEVSKVGWERIWHRYTAGRTGEKPGKGGLGFGVFVVPGS